MAKTYVRVDDRLIHGQTVVAWAPTLGVQEIVGVDDVNASNPTLRSIMTMGVPKQYKAHIVTTEGAREILAKDSGLTRLVIVKTPHKLIELEDSIAGCEQIYLGNMAKRPDTNHQMTGATGIFFLSDVDIEEISGLVERGFSVAFQQLPNTEKRDWASYVRSL